MHLAIYGKTGIGKTYTLYHLLESKGRHVILIRSLEELSKLKKLDCVTDIIFDDISFERSRPELLIHLCDQDFHSTIRILHQIVEIPPTIHKWFTHNNIEAFQPILASFEQLEAIRRRLQIVKVNSRKEVHESILQILQGIKGNH